MVGWVGSQVEWCIVGVVVGVWVVLELGLVVMEGPVSVPPPSWPRRQAPPLPRTTLVTSTLVLLPVGGAVQRVSAGAALVEAALVALLPGAMRARCAHARGWSLEGRRQESRRRWR